jgi:hypothetical protein
VHRKHPAEIAQPNSTLIRMIAGTFHHFTARQRQMAISDGSR